MEGRPAIRLWTEFEVFAAGEVFGSSIYGRSSEKDYEVAGLLEGGGGASVDVLGEAEGADDGGGED